MKKRVGRAGKELNEMIQQKVEDDESVIDSEAEGARLHYGRYDKGATDHEVRANDVENILDCDCNRCICSLRRGKLAFTPGQHVLLRELEHDRRRS